MTNICCDTDFFIVFENVSKLKMSDISYPFQICGFEILDYSSRGYQKDYVSLWTIMKTENFRFSARILKYLMPTDKIEWHLFCFGRATHETDSAPQAKRSGIRSAFAVKRVFEVTVIWSSKGKAKNVRSSVEDEIPFARRRPSSILPWLSACFVLYWTKKSENAVFKGG